MGVDRQVENALHGGEELGWMNPVDTVVNLPQKQPSTKREWDLVDEYPDSSTLSGIILRHDLHRLTEVPQDREFCHVIYKDLMHQE